MTHVIDHIINCGLVGEITGTLTITDDETGEVFKVNKGSRGLFMAVFSPKDMEHKQVEKATKGQEKLQHEWYKLVQVGDEQIHYDASAPP